LNAFVEERGRLKIIPNAFGERAVVKLMFGTLIRAAESWRSVQSPKFEHGRSLPSEKNSIRNTKAQVGLKYRGRALRENIQEEPDSTAAK